MSDVPRWKVVGVDLAIPGSDHSCYRHRAAWYFYDSQNLRKHAVEGPIFLKRGAWEEIRAMQEFSKLFHKSLLKHPPVDPHKIRAEQSKAKSRL